MIEYKFWAAIRSGSAEESVWIDETEDPEEAWMDWAYGMVDGGYEKIDD